MRVLARAALAASLILIGCAVWGAHASAQTIERTAVNLALKNGETIEVSSVYFIGSNCRALTTATPVVEVLDGPPGVSAAIKPAMIVPRGYGCAKPVSGGKLFFSANEIDDYSHSTMVVRITYKTRDGDLQRSSRFNVTLFP
jgi:hypothetical protein